MDQLFASGLADSDSEDDDVKTMMWSIDVPTADTDLAFKLSNGAVIYCHKAIVSIASKKLAKIIQKQSEDGVVDVQIVGSASLASSYQTRAFHGPHRPTPPSSSPPRHRSQAVAGSAPMRPEPHLRAGPQRWYCRNNDGGGRNPRHVDLRAQRRAAL